MKLKLFACLVVGALVSVTSAVAAPEFTPFLSVDVNGYQNPDGLALPGPTETGFLPWDVETSLLAPWDLSTNASGISQVFATSMGNVTATIIGHTAGVRSARDRGAGANGGPGEFESLRQDFIYATRPADGFGQFWIELHLSGLLPDQNYEFTGFAQDVFNTQGDPTLDDSSFQSWTDIVRLGGLNGPGAWLDANVSLGAEYFPSIGGVNNPIPTAVRAPITGEDPMTLGVSGYHYSATFRSKSNASGELTIYTWADPNGYSGTQTVSLINGFQLGVAPEPGTFALFGLGLIGIAGLRRRAG